MNSAFNAWIAALQSSSIFVDDTAEIGQQIMLPLNREIKDELDLVPLANLRAFYVPRWPCVDAESDEERIAIAVPKSWSPDEIAIAQIIGRPSKKEWRAFLDEYGVSEWLRNDKWFEDDDCGLSEGDIEKFEQRKSAWLGPQDKLLRSCQPNVAPRETLFEVHLWCDGAPGMGTWYGWQAISLTQNHALITTNAEAFEYNGPKWLPAKINGVVPRSSLYQSTALLLRRHGVAECFPAGWGFFEEDFWEIEADGTRRAHSLSSRRHELRL